jgi:tryptophan synthase beta chain
VTTTPIPRSNQSDANAATPQPDALGRFGKYGGKYVPETLMPALSELEQSFNQYRNDPDFQKELQQLMWDALVLSTSQSA